MKKLILTEAQYKALIKEMTMQEINDECQNVNLTPTEAQKKASNYKMGHVSVKGMRISIENPKGSKRYFKNENGEQDYNIMKNHYGYFNISKGKDGDCVDVFLGPEIEDFENVYCVDQNNEEGEFDETKVMLGFKSKEQAKKAYLSNYKPDWKGFRSITGVSLKVFKKWLYRGRKQRQPFADYIQIKKQELKESKSNEKPNVKTLGDGTFKGKIFGNTFTYNGKEYFSDLGALNIFPTEATITINGDNVEIK